MVEPGFEPRSWGYQKLGIYAIFLYYLGEVQGNAPQRPPHHLSRFREKEVIL